MTEYEQGLSNGTILDYNGEPVIIIKSRYYKYKPSYNSQEDYESYCKSKKIESY